MIDTKPGYDKKQMEIILSMTPRQRFIEGADMIDFGYSIVKNSILSKNPNITENELIIEVIKRLYPNEFSKEEIDKISHSL